MTHNRRLICVFGFFLREAARPFSKAALEMSKWNDTWADLSHTRWGKDMHGIGWESSPQYEC